MSQVDNEYGKPVRSRTVGDWARENRVESWMLPLQTRKLNPLDLIKRTSEKLEELPKTQSTFYTRQLDISKLPAKYRNGIMQLFLLRPCDNIQCKSRYLNPDYMHYGHSIDKIKDVDRRMQFFEMFRDSPRINTEWFATHWGVSRSAVSKFLQHRDITIQRVRQENRERLGRTLRTIQTWGYSIMDLARLMPMETRTARGLALNYGRNNEEWEPPERPTDEPWYSNHMNKHEK